MPTLSLGIAGPFIGDRAFADAYQEPFRLASEGTWWQTETVNKKNSSQYDDVAGRWVGGWVGDESSAVPSEVVSFMRTCIQRTHPPSHTTESYQVPPDGRDLYIQRNALCAFPIHPLKIPEQAFGYHDLRQYHLFLSGKDCDMHL